MLTNYKTRSFHYEMSKGVQLWEDAMKPFDYTELTFSGEGNSNNIYFRFAILNPCPKSDFSEKTHSQISSLRRNGREMTTEVRRGNKLTQIFRSVKVKIAHKKVRFG